MGMAAILFDGAEPFEQIGNSLLAEGPMWVWRKLLEQFQKKDI